jgi:hypothetical protein
MTHHNQTKELTTWFINLPLDEYIDNKKHNVWSSNPKPHEAQLQDKRPRMAQEGHLKEGKTIGPRKEWKAANQSK